MRVYAPFTAAIAALLVFMPTPEAPREAANVPPAPVASAWCENCVPPGVCEATGSGTGVWVSADCGAAEAVAITGWLYGQAVRQPTVLWTIDSDQPGDTLLTLPYGVAVNRRSGTIFVADLRLPGIVELDGNTGRLVRVLGRSGSGPGEFGAPQHVAVSPNGTMLAVYDVRRGSVDVLRLPQGGSIRRVPVGSFSFLKALAITDDTTLVLSGGRPGLGKVPVGMTWVGPDGVTGTGPVPPRLPAPEGTSFAVQMYAGGGPLLHRAGRILLAEAITGDVYETSPTAVRKVARGLGIAPGAMESIIRESPGGRFVVSFDFTRAVALDTIGGGGFLVAWTDPPRKQVSLVAQRGQEPPQTLSRWSLHPAIMEPYDTDTYVIVEHSDGGWRVKLVRLR